MSLKIPFNLPSTSYQGTGGRPLNELAQTDSTQRFSLPQGVTYDRANGELKVPAEVFNTMFVDSSGIMNFPFRSLDSGGMQFCRDFNKPVGPIFTSDQINYLRQLAQDGNIKSINGRAVPPNMWKKLHPDSEEKVIPTVRFRSIDPVNYKSR